MLELFLALTIDALKGPPLKRRIASLAQVFRDIIDGYCWWD
jgi:hypothetical protein